MTKAFKANKIELERNLKMPNCGVTRGMWTLQNRVCDLVKKRWLCELTFTYRSRRSGASCHPGLTLSRILTCGTLLWKWEEEKNKQMSKQSWTRKNKKARAAIKQTIKKVIIQSISISFESHTNRNLTFPQTFKLFSQRTGGRYMYIMCVKWILYS